MRRLILALVTLLPAAVFAHGEDKPGPHGGVIRMPGAYHTEAVPGTGRSFKVYLLDMEWKNPSIADSGVSASAGGVSAACLPVSDHFVCTFPKAVLTKGTLVVKSRRAGQEGNEAKYSLPLKAPAAKADGAAETSGHHGH